VRLRPTALALAALLDDEGRRAAMREVGRAHARRFQDEAVAERLWRVYRELGA
jgi:glycosyltransferase involved in cell wall biosynthesis